MKEIIYTGNDNLMDVINNYNIDIKKEVYKYRNKNLRNLSITGMIYMYTYIIACGTLNLNVYAAIVPTFIAQIAASITVLNNSIKYEKQLKDKVSKAEENIQKIVYSLYRENCYVSLENFKKDNVLILNKKKQKNRNDKEYINDIVFLTDSNNINIIRQIKRYNGKKLILQKYYIIDHDKNNQNIIDQYKKQLIFSKKSNKFVEGQNEDYI